MISGGVFNRAEGLWKEVHADLFAKTARQAIAVAEAAKPKAPEIVIPGAPQETTATTPATTGYDRKRITKLIPGIIQILRGLVAITTKPLFDD